MNVWESVRGMFRVRMLCTHWGDCAGNVQGENVVYAVGECAGNVQGKNVVNSVEERISQCGAAGWGKTRDMNDGVPMYALHVNLYCKIAVGQGSERW